ncbi:MAG: preprotein translocase subunit SecG [Planctomycetes bacterium]|nr:preprotein translocase subunit SecG [Planctomycetota bacterium]
MINLPLANILINFIAVVWLLSALLLIGIILIQKGKGGGLGGAFGGAGGGGGLLGTKTGDFLTWVTIGLVFLFFFLAIILVKFGKLSVDEDLKGPGPDAKTGAPAGGTGGSDEKTPVIPDTTDEKPGETTE